MKLTYSPRALADLDAIADYLKPRSPQGAVRVRANILQTLQTLQRFPGFGRRQMVEGVRKIGVRNTHTSSTTASIAPTRKSTSLPFSTAPANVSSPTTDLWPLRARVHRPS